MQTVFDSLRASGRLGLAIGVGLSVAAGLVSAWLAPRGPVTAAQVLLSMAGALVVGVLAGLAIGNRWSLLVAPLLFVAVFEVARAGTSGPSVDRLHLGSAYGLIAFVTGRLIPYLLVLAPMVLGALYGAWGAGRLSGDSEAGMGAFGWAITGVASVGVVALAAYVAQPARTAPVLGADGQQLPGSIAELTTVSIGGHNQSLLIRGRSTDNPVLLHLAGGPGGTDVGAMRADVGLEQDLLVVTWDQRGTGKSYAALDPVHTLTLDQMVRDTIEVTDYLRSRFGQDRIYLTGNSWGTLLGVLAVQQRPELYHAFVGTGRMVSTRETDIMFYEDTLAWAEQTGNHALTSILQRNGPPPYSDLLAYEPTISHEHDWNPYPELGPSREMPFNMLVPENTFLDVVNGLRGLLDVFAALYPQLQDLDLRVDVPSLDVPVYIVTGAHEARGRAIPAQEWFDMLQAPHKEMLVFEHSGHRPSFEEPAEFAALMARVLHSTDGGE